MKSFIYLVQGKAELVKNYLHLLDKPDADVIALTYDRPIEEAIFFPNSTWAQGRNKLLEVALSKGEYLYYIFCDDDIKFIKGDWNLFEEQVLTYKPAVAVPINPKTIRTPLKSFQYQSFLTNDEQLIAFHRDVVKDSILLPYQEQFDHIYWWAACQIQEELIQIFYFSGAIQFNHIQISNDAGENYVRPESESDFEELHRLVDSWLAGQFRGQYNKMPSPKRRPAIILSRTFRFYLYRLLSTPKYSVEVDELKKVLSPGSELYKQAISRREKLACLH
jgi:hypothetical protein